MRVLKFSDSIAERFNSKKINPSKVTPLQTFLMASLNETRSHLEAIISLCRVRLGDQAGLIARTLFEIYITLKFLQKHPEQLDRYLSYADYLKLIRLKGLERRESVFSIDNERKKEIRRKGKRAKKRYHFKFKWNPPEFSSIKSLCKEVGEEKSYESSYAYLSDFVHFNSFALFKHEYEESHGERILVSKQSWGEEHLGFSTELALRLYKFIDDAFELKLNDSIMKYYNRLRA